MDWLCTTIQQPLFLKYLILSLKYLILSVIIYYDNLYCLVHKKHFPRIFKSYATFFPLKHSVIKVFQAASPSSFFKLQLDDFNG